MGRKKKESPLPSVPSTPDTTTVPAPSNALAVIVPLVDGAHIPIPTDQPVQIVTIEGGGGAPTDQVPAFDGTGEPTFHQGPALPDVLPEGFKLPRKALTIGGVFAQLQAYTSDAERIAWLRHNDKPVLRYLLRLGFEQVEWVIPKGLPPYKPLQIRRGKRVVEIKPGQAPTELYLEARRLYLFVKGGADTMDRMRREKVFQQIIEDMEPIEVDVLTAIKDKQLARKFVTQEVVDRAFPGLFASPFQLRFIRRG